MTRTLDLHPDGAIGPTRYIIMPEDELYDRSRAAWSWLSALYRSHEEAADAARQAAEETELAYAVCQVREVSFHAPRKLAR